MACQRWATTTNQTQRSDWCISSVSLSFRCRLQSVKSLELKKMHYLVDPFSGFLPEEMYKHVCMSIPMYRTWKIVKTTECLGGARGTGADWRMEIFPVCRWVSGPVVLLLCSSPVPQHAVVFGAAEWTCKHVNKGHRASWLTMKRGNQKNLSYEGWPRKTKVSVALIKKNNCLGMEKPCPTSTTSIKFPCLSLASLREMSSTVILAHRWYGALS